MPLSSLDRRSVIPLYYQIRERLIEQIHSRALKSGDALPSEQELAGTLGVSRMTARQALKSLCELGFAYSEQGKGTFVSASKLEKNFRQVLSFSEEMAQRGLKASSRVLSAEVCAAKDEIAASLQLHSGEKVFRLRRIRMANSAPMGIESSSIPQRLCPDLLEHLEPSKSLYKQLAQRYRIEIAIAEEEVEASLARAEEARLLGISKGSPVFVFTRVSYLQSGQPAEYVKSTYRGDRYKITNRLTRVGRELGRAQKFA